MREVDERHQHSCNFKYGQHNNLVIFAKTVYSSNLNIYMTPFVAKRLNLRQSLCVIFLKILKILEDA